MLKKKTTSLVKPKKKKINKNRIYQIFKLCFAGLDILSMQICNIFGLVIVIVAEYMGFTKFFFYFTGVSVTKTPKTLTDAEFRSIFLPKFIIWGSVWLILGT